MATARRPIRTRQIEVSPPNDPVTVLEEADVDPQLVADIQQARERSVAELAAKLAATANPTPKEEMAAAASPAATPLVLPVEVTFYRPRPLTVVLVGAGGTGARLGPDIARLLMRGDKLIVVDPDTVEERNLIRQHFVRGDVGRSKAEVVARRSALSAGAGVEVTAQVAALTAENFPAFNTTDTSGRSGTLWIGAVDTRACRQLAARLLCGQQGLWIDAGNELRGGQVGLMGNAYAVSVVDNNVGRRWPTANDLRQRAQAIAEGIAPERAARYGTHLVYLNTLAEETPQILRPNPEEEKATEECGLRIDTQSLAANVMAYACVINLVSRYLDELPISTGMAFFSTANTISTKPLVEARAAAGETGIVVTTRPGMSYGRSTSALAAYIATLCRQRA